MIEVGLSLKLLFFSGGLLAGTVDAIAGGGGLISLPLLISVGLPAPVALGTNKLQASIGTFVATYNYFRNNLISFQIIIKGLLFGFLGATSGSLAAQFISSVFLEKILPILMLIIFLYTIYTPKLGLIDSKQRLKESIFYMIFGFGLGFYDGFLGPGTGSFWVIALVFFLGYNLSKATAYTKVFNLKSNLIATSWFMLGYHIDYKIAFMMACGQFLGGKIGSQLVILNGAKVVRPIFLMIVFFTILMMFCKSYIGFENVIKLIATIKLNTFTIFFVAIILSIVAVNFWRDRNKNSDVRSNKINLD